MGQNRSNLERQYGQDLMDIGGTRGDLQRQLAGDITGVGTGIAGIGSNLAGYGSQLGDLGATQQRLAGQDINMLEGLGSVNRGIDQQRLNNQYNQEYATRMAPTQAASYIQGFAPQYQGSQTMINKTYGMPVDPRNAAIAAGIGTYNSLKQPNTQYQPDPANQAQADLYRTQTEEIRARMNAGQGATVDPNAGASTPTYGNYQAPGTPTYGNYQAPGPAGTGTGYQGGPVNTQGAFNSNQYNPLNPNPYQPGQINTQQQGVMPNFSRVQPNGFIAY
jgi:hypothetical protein